MMWYNIFLCFFTQCLERKGALVAVNKKWGNKI